MNFFKQHFNKKTLTFSFFLLIFAEFIYNVSGFVIQIGLLKILSVADNGRFSLVTSVVTLTTILATKGIPTAMMKKISENKNDFALTQAIKKTSAKLQFYLIALLTIAFYFSAPILARIYGDLTLTLLFKFNTLVIPIFALSSFHVVYFNGMKRFGAMTSMKISRGFFRVFWIVGLAYFFGLKGAFWGSVLAPLFVFLDAFFMETFIFKDNEKAKELPEKTYSYKPLIHYSQAYLFFVASYELFTRTDNFLIKIFLKDDHLVGIYTASMTLALIPNYLVLALTIILFPTISSHKASGDHEKIRKLVKKVILILFSVLVPFAIFLPIFSQLLTRWSLFGEKYVESINYIPLMMVGMVFITIFNVLASIWNGAGYIKITSILSVSAILLSSVLNYFFIFDYGIKATAIIFSISSAFIGVILLVLTYFKFLRAEK